MDTINISANTRKLQICASKDPSRNLDAVFFQKGYAFATNGHYLVIRPTLTYEPQDMALQLPKAKGKKILDLEAQDIEGRLISLTEGEAIKNDSQGPDVSAVLRSITGNGSKTIKITINATYLLDLAKAIGADADRNCAVTLEFDPADSCKAILVATKDSATVGVLMPLNRAKAGDVVPSDILSPILAIL